MGWTFQITSLIKFKRKWRRARCANRGCNIKSHFLTPPPALFRSVENEHATLFDLHCLLSSEHREHRSISDSLVVHVKEILGGDPNKLIYTWYLTSLFGNIHIRQKIIYINFLHIFFLHTHIYICLNLIKITLRINKLQN